MARTPSPTPVERSGTAGHLTEEELVEELQQVSLCLPEPLGGPTISRKRPCSSSGSVCF